MKDRLQKRIHITSEILSKISRIDEFKGLWLGSAKLNPYALSRLKSSVIITSTGASTRIEGAKVTDDEIARLIRGLKTGAPKGRDEEEVAGYADLLGRIFDNYEILKLTEGQILQFHKILLNYSTKDKDHSGEYKRKENTVVAFGKNGEQIILFQPTPPYLVKKEMDDATAWLEEELEKKELHPLLVISNFIFEFLAIHPFVDGNGRLSRALTNFLLLKSGYSYMPYLSLEEIIEENQTQYYLSLRKTQKHHKTKNEDITAWLIFFLDTLIEQTARLRVIMSGEQPESILSEKQIKVYQLFGSKELGVLEIYKLLDGKVILPTIKKSLSRLVKLGYLERIGLGRATRYRKLKA